MNEMYSPSMVVLSFFIAFLGSYASISACEQFRLSKIGIVYSQYASPLFYLVLMAISLGGAGIWCMHFVGMAAMSLPDADGNHLELRYDIGITLLSLVLVIMFTLVGFYVSSHDVVFMKTKREIVEMFVEDAAAMSMKDVQKMKTFQMVMIIGTRAPQHLLLGGLITGSGVVVMHYLGMAAMRFHGHIVWNAGVIAASVIIAFVASVAAFWILLRLLSIYPDQERLRLASAFTMAVAVCGMHYTGMSAAEFQLDPSVIINVDTTMSFREAFLSGLLVTAVIFASVVIFVFADLRRSVLKMSTELYRADTFVKSIPHSNSCSGNAAKYIKKRKQSKFNLGVLNDTASLRDHEMHDDSMSVFSDDIPASWFQQMKYRLHPRMLSRQLSGGFSLESLAHHNNSVHRVHPEIHPNLHHDHDELLYSANDCSGIISTNASDLDRPCPVEISNKPDASTASHTCRTRSNTVLLPPLHFTHTQKAGIAEVEGENEMEDLEKGLTRNLQVVEP